MSNRKEQSIKKYAASVLGESLVTGVSNIVNTPNWKRKAFKFFVLLQCSIGFLYQTTQFLSHVLTYPSIVDIYVFTPNEHIFPAITICNSNGIKRSKFCERYPEKCETPKNKTQFCLKYPNYCEGDMKWEDLKIPKRDFYKFENEASLKDLTDLGHDLNTLINVTYNLVQIENFTGPFIFFKNEKTGFSCYTYNSRANSSSNPAVMQSLPFRSTNFELEVDFEPSEVFLPGRKPGGFLSVHSPFEIVNPFDFGHRIKPGKIYKVHIKMIEEQLLPSPYQSDCVNYTEMWEDNDRKGPRSQEMCRTVCLFKHATDGCNCSFKGINYYSDEETCFSDPDDCFGPENFVGLIDCLGACKEECEKYKFDYTVQERVIDENDWENEDQKEAQKTFIALYASDPEVVVYRHKPRYESVEIFSYIGGYIGIWLGISLVAVIDFIEGLFLILTFAFRRKKQAQAK